MRQKGGEQKWPKGQSSTEKMEKSEGTLLAALTVFLEGEKREEVGPLKKKEVLPKPNNKFQWGS